MLEAPIGAPAPVRVLPRRFCPARCLVAGVGRRRLREPEPRECLWGTPLDGRERALVAFTIFASTATHGATAWIAVDRVVGRPSTEPPP